jgi:hypothetical protein
LVNYFHEKKFKTHNHNPTYHAGIKPALKVVINKRTRGKHIPHFRNALTKQTTGQAGAWHFEKSRLTGIKHLVRGDKTQKSATHFRFFLHLTLGLNILTKHCRILLVMVCL